MIKLTGVQIVGSKRQMKSGLMRYTIELTESDTKLYGPTLSTAEIHQRLSDVTFEFTEKQDEHQVNASTGEVIA